MKIDFSKAKFIKSVVDINLKPKTLNKEIVFLGRSNVGKSSLINALVNNSNLAKTSSKPGLTKMLNYFEIDSKFYLVDAPGYGYAKGGIDLDKLFLNLMNSYFVNNSQLKGALLLVDARRELNEMDEMMKDFLIKYKIPFILVVTKIDKINQSEKYKIQKHLKEKGIEENKIKYVSSFKKDNIISLQKDIASLLNN